MKVQKYSHREAAGFFRSLALLLHAGVTQADALFLLAREQREDPMLTRMGQQLDGGALLSDALEDSGIFGPDVWGMVRVGEASGRVEEALEALAEFYEESHRTTRQLRSVLAYPSMLMVLMLAVIGVLLIRVLPVFDRVYASLGSGLTGAAAGLLRAGQLLETLLPVLLALLCLGVLAVLLYSLWGAFRARVDSVLHRWFADRGIARRFHNARFARALAMGLRSGLSPEESVSLARLLLTDAPGAQSRCDLCVRAMDRGESLTDSLQKAQLLSPADCRLLAVGIRGGSGDEMMEQIARRMMAEAVEALDRAISRVEPAMVLTASALVGLILLSVMLPLMHILSDLG